MDDLRGNEQKHFFCSTCSPASPPVPRTTRKKEKEEKKKKKKKSRGKHVLPKAIFQDKHGSQSALMEVKPRHASTPKQTYRAEPTPALTPGPQPARDRAAGGV